METRPYALLLKLSVNISKDVYTPAELGEILEKKSEIVDCIYCEELDKAHPKIIRQLMSDCPDATHYILTYGQLQDNEARCCSKVTSKILQGLTSSPSGVELGENYNLYMLPNKHCKT